MGEMLQESGRMMFLLSMMFLTSVENKKQQTDDNAKKEYCEDELDKAEDKKKGLAQAALHRLTQISRQPSMMIHRQGR